LGRAYLATKLHFFSKERRLEGVLEMASQTKVWVATIIFQGQEGLLSLGERGLVFIKTLLHQVLLPSKVPLQY
jgi:hypothetical protein